MVPYVGAKIAAPGYSNHQAGLAIDFQQLLTTGVVRNDTGTRWTAAWRRTWFYKWLLTNASGFGFAPYDKEPWHWTYQRL